MAPRPSLLRPLRFITAAASQIKLDPKGKANAPKRERWQTDAWDMADLIPEVSQSVTFLANVVSGVRLYVAVRPDDMDGPPSPAEPGTPGADAAWDVLRRLRDGSVQGGLGGLLYTSVFNLKVPGECWVLGEPATSGNPLVKPPIPAHGERWDVRSIDEVTIERGSGGDWVVVKDTPNAKGRRLPLPPEDPTLPVPDDAAIIWRVWDRHPRYSGLARSSMRAVLEQCDELLLLGKAIRVSVRRHLAGNGLLAVPSELDLPGPPTAGDEGEDPELSPLMRKLGNAMVNAMMDESNPDSLVPILTMAPGDLLEKLQHISFGAALDSEVRELLGAIKKRLLDGLDLPSEQVSGIAQTNHWNAWMVDSATWARYGHPTTRLIVDSWTEGLLWALLESDYGLPTDVTRRLCIWFDPSDAIMDPDEGKTADELFDRGAISYEAYRRRKGANDDEAPTPEELNQRAALGLFRGRGTAGEPVPNQGEAATASALEFSAVLDSNGNGWHPIVAAAPRSLGRRLMEIDRTLRTRLLEGAEAAVRRALSAAGARVRSRAQGNSNITAAIAGVPAHAIPARLGPGVLASLLAAQDMSEDDLLEGGVDDFEPRFLALVGAAQARTLALLAQEFDLDEAERDEMQRRQDEERSEAWLWLAGALLGLARTRLHDPTPSAPPLGEGDTSSTVPTGMVREAMARAGGGGQAVAEAGPVGGVATGVDVLALWNRHGMIVGGWEWVYGDSERSFPAHEDLDGVEFANFQDPVLALRPDDAWLGVSHYKPGDHSGCLCDVVALPVEAAAAEAVPLAAAGRRL